MLKEAKEVWKEQPTLQISASKANQTGVATQPKVVQIKKAVIGSLQKSREWFIFVVNSIFNLILLAAFLCCFTCMLLFHPSYYL